MCSMNDSSSCIDIKTPPRRSNSPNSRSSSNSSSGSSVPRNADASPRTIAATIRSTGGASSSAASSASPRRPPPHRRRPAQPPRPRARRCCWSAATPRWRLERLGELLGTPLQLRRRLRRRGLVGGPSMPAYERSPSTSTHCSLVVDCGPASSAASAWPPPAPLPPSSRSRSLQGANGRWRTSVRTTHGTPSADGISPKPSRRIATTDALGDDATASARAASAPQVRLRCRNARHPSQHRACGAPAARRHRLRRRRRRGARSRPTSQLVTQPQERCKPSASARCRASAGSATAALPPPPPRAPTTTTTTRAHGGGPCVGDRSARGHSLQSSRASPWQTRRRPPAARGCAGSRRGPSAPRGRRSRRRTRGARAAEPRRDPRPNYWLRPSAARSVGGGLAAAAAAAAAAAPPWRRAALGAQQRRRRGPERRLEAGAREAAAGTAAARATRSAP